VFTAQNQGLARQPIRHSLQASFGLRNLLSTECSTVCPAPDAYPQFERCTTPCLPGEGGGIPVVQRCTTPCLPGEGGGIPVGKRCTTPCLPGEGGGIPVVQRCTTPCLPGEGGGYPQFERCTTPCLPGEGGGIPVVQRCTTPCLPCLMPAGDASLFALLRYRLRAKMCVEMCVRSRDSFDSQREQEECGVYAHD
jgi:hypothetical protein